MKKCKTILKLNGEWIVCMQISFFKSWQEEACAGFLKSLICCVSFSLKHFKDWSEIHDFNKTRFGMGLNNNSEWLRVQGNGISLVLNMFEGRTRWSLLLPFYLRKMVSLSLPLFLSWFLKKIYLFIFILFLAVLSLCCCTWAFSSCDGLGLLSCCNAWASHSGGFSCCRKQVLGHVGSLAVAHGLSWPMACGIFPKQRSNPSSPQW